MDTGIPAYFHDFRITQPTRTYVIVLTRFYRQKITAIQWTDALIKAFFKQIVAQGTDQHPGQGFKIERCISHKLESNLYFMTGIPRLNTAVVHNHDVTFL